MSELAIAQKDLDRAQRDLSWNRSAQALVASSGKDTSQLRVQERFLSKSVDEAQSRVNRLTSVTTASQTDSVSSEFVKTGVESSSGSGTCKTTLAHLAPQLPTYDVVEIEQTRSAILQENLQAAARRAKAMGLSTADAASQALQAANNADEQVKVAQRCIKNFANNPDDTISSLEGGTFKFSGRSIAQLSINESCAAQYVVLKYSAIATREGALQMACLAQGS